MQYSWKINRMDLSPVFIVKIIQNSWWCPNIFVLHDRRFSLPIHMYINDHYSLLVRITTGFLTSLMLCVLISFVSGGTYSLKSTANHSRFEKLSNDNFSCSQIFLPEICWKSPKKFFFLFFQQYSWCYWFRPSMTQHLQNL